jgi:glycosyltransferase involved in cell wall biosynthesis
LLFDATRLIWRRWRGRLPTGIDRVCLAYLNEFGGESQAVVNYEHFRRLLDRHASEELFGLLGEGPERFREKLIGGLFRHLRGMRCAGDQRPYLNVGHTGLNSRGFREWVCRQQIKPVYFVHDLIPITQPSFCRAGESERHRERMRTVLTTGSAVIGNSNSTLDQLNEFAAKEGLICPPSIAAWLGSEKLKISVRESDAGQPTFVILGTIEARKNHRLLLEIWAELVEEYGHRGPRLLIIGQRGWEADDVFEILNRNKSAHINVVEISECSDAELRRHLGSARALLFPSRAEGFGLPLVEALGAGIPVLASNLPVFHEIGGSLPDYLEPSDKRAWKEAIMDYSAPDSVRRAQQVRRIQGFDPPTWRNHFDRVRACLNRVGLTAEPFQHRLD